MGRCAPAIAGVELFTVAGREQPSEMEAFGPAVDGYYDVADQLRTAIRERAFEQFAAEADATGVGSPEAVTERVARTRQFVHDRIGGLPEPPTALEPSRTVLASVDGCEIEALTFQSLPQFHVTANCYVPDGTGPHPAICMFCGHVPEAKGDRLNQRTCLELARNGFVVLIVDPICQGERQQYFSPETGEPRFGTAGGTFAHCYAGHSCFLSGQNLARYLINDAKRAIDYLETRNDVDTDRIGVIGTSGGGLQTSYLCLFDDRPAVAAPCCSVTERREWLKTGKRIDAEQAIPGMISAGINIADLLAAVAPRPLCIGAARSDEYFPIEGVETTLDRLQATYDAVGAGEKLTSITVDTGHCAVHEFGAPLYRWLCETLDAGEYVPHEAGPVRDPTELHCTPNGSVLAHFENERSLETVIQNEVDPAPEPCSLEELRERFGLDRVPTAPHVRTTSSKEQDGITTERIWFKSETDPDIVVTAVLIRGNEPEGGGTAVVLWDGGTAAIPDRREELAGMLERYGTLAVVDPRGVGATTQREIPIPSWLEDDDHIYGTTFKLAYDALLLDDSLLAMRSRDICAALEVVTNRPATESVTILAEGLGRYYALYAGLFVDRVSGISLDAEPRPFLDHIGDPHAPYDPALTVFDMRDADLPMVREALADRGVSVSIHETLASVDV